MATKNKQPVKKPKPSYAIAIRVLSNEKTEAKRQVAEFKKGINPLRESFIRAWQSRVDSCMLGITALRVQQGKLNQLRAKPSNPRHARLQRNNRSHRR